MRGATILEGPLLHFVVISIHAPNAGSDRQAAYRAQCDGDFKPRSPCGERPVPHTGLIRIATISTHAPHAGSDLLQLYQTVDEDIFQPTLPMRGATADINKSASSILFI